MTHLLRAFLAGRRHILTLSTMVFLGALPVSEARVLSAPNPCAISETSLRIQNNLGEPLRFWTQEHLEDEILERSWDLPPHSEKTLSGSDFLRIQSSFSVKAAPAQGWNAWQTCPQKEETPLSEKTSPAKWMVPAKSQAVAALYLDFLNLHHGPQSVTAVLRGPAGQILKQETFLLENHYVTSSFKWDLPLFPTSEVALEIHGEGRVQVRAVGISHSGEEASWLEVPLPPLLLQAAPEKIYFLVGKRDSSEDSYVMGTKDPEIIAQARDQIQGTGFPKIVVARIQKAGLKDNRNFFSVDKAPYTWSVTDVDALADFAHISCDGSPDLVEERLESYLNDGGRICFWRYRVLRELSAEEVRTGLLNTP